jgi:hypothetical protein
LYEDEWFVSYLTDVPVSIAKPDGCIPGSSSDVVATAYAIVAFRHSIVKIGDRILAI